MWVAWLIRAFGALAKIIPTAIILKIIIGSFALIIVPKVLKYVFLKWGDEVMSCAIETIEGLTGIQYSGLIVEFTGFVGYVAGLLRVVDSFSMIVTASITCFLLSFLRK